MAGSGVASPQSGLEVELLDTVRSVSRAEWNGVVERSSRGGVFHRHEWLDAVESHLDREPGHLLLRKDGNLVGVFPNVVAELQGTPFQRLTSTDPGFGGPLVTTDVSKALPRVLDAVDDLCTGRTIVHEIRARDTSYLRYNDVLRDHGYRPYRRECRFLIHLQQGYEEIFDGMSSSRRKGIRRGRETDHELVAENVTEESLRRFHETYERVMDRVGGAVCPLAFFEALLAMRERLLLVTLRIDGEYAGGMLELLDENHSCVYGFKAAVPREYFEHHASELLYDHVIRWGIEHGYETYDLGVTDADYENGIFRYKEGFGGQVIPTLIWERGCSPAWPLMRTGRELYWRYHDRLPPVSDALRSRGTNGQ